MKKFLPFLISLILPMVAAAQSSQKIWDGVDTAKVTTAGELEVKLNSAPLPTGAATEATLAAINAKITTINTGAVVVSSSALPTGAATAANQSTLNGYVDGIEALLTTIDADTGNIATSVASLDSKVTACNTGAVTVASSALPTGASTSANQTSGNASLTSIDGKITTCNTGAVTVASSALPTGASTGAKQDTGNASLSSIDSKITAVNTGAVVVASSALPTGAATSANQTTGNTSLSSIDTKLITGITADYDTGAGTQNMQMHGIALPASGGAVAGGTATNPLQVSLANTAANSTAVKTDGSAVTQPVSGTVTCNAGTNLNTSALATSANQTTELGYLDGVETLLGALNTTSNFDSKTGSLTETAPASDTASSGLNGRLQRIAQNVTTLTGKFPSALTGSGNFKVALSETTVTQPVSGTVTANPMYCASFSQTSVSASTSSVTLISANGSRKRLIACNDSTSASAYVRPNASAATSSNWTWKLLPQSCLDEPYTGEVRAIWTAASGSMRITECL